MTKFQRGESDSVMATGARSQSGRKLANKILDMGDEDLKELMDPVNLMYFQ